MKIKLLKCEICHEWFSPKRLHCPNCGATKIAENVHVDCGNSYRPGIVIGRSVTHFSVQWQTEGRDLLLQIAREMAK